MAEPVDSIEVEVCLVAGGQVVRQLLRVPAGSKVEDALVAAGRGDVLVARAASQVGVNSEAPYVVAVFGRLVSQSQILEDADRIELLPPLRVDPKVARQRRVEHRRRMLASHRWAPDQRRAAVPVTSV